MPDLKAIQDALVRNETAIDEALGAKAPTFWGDVTRIVQPIDEASDQPAREEAASRLEALCQRHPEVWKLVSPPAKPTPAPQRPPKPVGDEKEKPPMTKPAAARKLSFENWLTALREGITGCLGVIIVLTTLLLLLSAFILLLLRPNAEFAPFHDMLLILNGMTGMVLGYYFGRMPAEARANQSEKARTVAEQQATKEATRSAVLRAGLRDLQADLSQPALTARAKGLAPAQLEATRAQVQRLLEQTEG